MLRTKNEGISEVTESEMKSESQVGTGSNDQSENRQMIQQEPVKIKVDRKKYRHNVYETKFYTEKYYAEKEIGDRVV